MRCQQEVVVGFEDLEVVDGELLSRLGRLDPNYDRRTMCTTGGNSRCQRSPSDKGGAAFNPAEDRGSVFCYARGAVAGLEIKKLQTAPGRGPEP
jgi:hypothetical protein